MYKCFYCGETVPKLEAVIDHRLPKSHAGYNKAENLVLAHQTCIPQKPSLWRRFLKWFDWSLCYKESQGYTCQHATRSNGTKECGEYPNYWKGDDEL